MSSRDFDILEVFCGGAKVLVDASVKEIRRKNGSIVAKSMKKFGSKEETFIAVFGKFEENKSGLGGAKSVKKSSGGGRETFVAVLSSMAQVAQRLSLLSLSLPDTSTNIFPRYMEESDGGIKTYATT